MTTLVYFGLIDESIALHGLVERVIRASLEAEVGFASVEQEQTLKR